MARNAAVGCRARAEHSPVTETQLNGFAGQRVVTWRSKRTGQPLQRQKVLLCSRATWARLCETPEYQDWTSFPTPLLVVAVGPPSPVLD